MEENNKKAKRTPKDIVKQMAIFDAKLYAITFNPKDQHDLTEDPVERLEYVDTDIRSRIARFLYNYVDEIHLFPDISFPTEIRTGKIPRIHFHGWLKVKEAQIVPFLLSLGIFARWYSIEIDTIDDFAYWQIYCRKTGKYFSTRCALPPLHKDTLKVIRQQKGLEKEVNLLTLDEIMTRYNDPDRGASSDDG